MKKFYNTTPKSRIDYIFGLRAVTEAIRNGKEIDKILIKKGLQGELYAELIQLVRELELPHQYVPEEKLHSVTRKNHQGVVAYISPIEFQKLEQLVPMLYESGKSPFIIVLDGITDVRNLGAIARTAECAGADALVIPVRKTAQVNADAVKTSAGALHHITVCRETSLVQACDFLMQSGLQLVAVTEKAENDYTKINYNQPTALVLGSEDEGISPKLINMASATAKIPVIGEIESLNVSVAAGVVIYEALRQRGNL